MKYGIIGSGPAGFTSAILAAEKGNTVVLFEKDEIGGTCLNKGCIPTKVIMHTAELYRKAKNASEIGLVADNLKIDFNALIKHKENVITLLRNSMTKFLESKNINIVKAYAEITSDNTITANNQEYKCDKIIVATGSIPKCLNGYSFDGEFILNSDDIFKLSKIPENVLIIGAGAEGLEWARIFNDMDCNVTINKKKNCALPVADNDISKYIENLLKQRGIDLKTSTTVKKLENRQVTLSTGEVLNPDFVLVAIGRLPLKPEKINGKVIYLGDTNAQLMLANFAIYQARALLSDIKFDSVFVPNVVYGEPEIAWIGANEQDLPVGSYEKSVFPIKALGKAHCENEKNGFIKVLSYQGNIIGAHIVSKEASALIHQFAVAMQNNIKTSELKKICFAHPTYSEGVYESIVKL